MRFPAADSKDRFRAFSSPSHCLRVWHINKMNKKTMRPTTPNFRGVHGNEVTELKIRKADYDTGAILTGIFN
jgi:hypothetical protein